MSKVKNYYSVSELVRILDKSRQQISLDCRLGKIKSRKFGKSYFVHSKTLVKLIQEQNAKSKQEVSK